MLALVESYVWFWGSAFPGSIFVVGFGVLGVAVRSGHRRGEHLRDIGLRLDNIRPALKDAASVTLPVVAVILGAGLAFGRVRYDWMVVVGRLPWLVGWGFLQQFVLQGFVHRRLREILDSDREREMATAAVFALCHLPNPRLMVATFVGGYIWAVLYRRKPNLIALAISHAVSSAAISIAFGQALMWGMRVGMGALDYEYHPPRLP